MKITNSNNEPLKPILFNALKHHSGYIRTIIESFGDDIEELQKSLLVIGDSQMDLYLGELSPEEIYRSIISKLRQLNVLEYEEYCKWLTADGKDFQTITLPDTSVWALRLSDDKDRYIHIHPGRYSPHTLRVKALQLKTAIAVLVHTDFSNADPLKIEVINRVRKEVLNESPIKSVEKSVGLANLIRILAAAR